MPHTIHQEVDIPATPAQVFAVLTDGDKFSAMTGGAPTEIGADEGDAFACFGGMILGRHIELVSAKRIVQAWRVKTWPPGVYSIVRFELSKQPGGTPATHITFDHTGFPFAEHDHLVTGWHDNYWGPMAKHLG